MASCTSTEKILKSSDSNLKYTKAMEWYNKGQYFKAIPVFEELMGLFKGEKSTEELYYYYCMANYKQGSYLMAAYHFKNYTVKHPYSKYAEEASFMHAESYKKQTLVYSLDQTETVNAIEAYQTFINAYSESERLPEANENIEILRARLEKKALKAADLYFNTKNYRAAAVSYKNLLLDYPDIEGVKEIQFNIVKSYSKYADQSISSKQQERYEQAIKTAKNFKHRYPKSEYLEDISKLNEEAHYNIIKANYNSAMSSVFLQRMKTLTDMPDIYANNFSKLTDEKLIVKANIFLEKSYFQKIKTSYAQGQDSDVKDKALYYKHCIEAYNVFSTKYAESKYLNEAKRMFLASDKKYKKYSNG
jgi:outer membrane protein assembly factor BamD